MAACTETDIHHRPTLFTRLMARFAYLGLTIILFASFPFPSSADHTREFHIPRVEVPLDVLASRVEKAIRSGVEGGNGGDHYRAEGGIRLAYLNLRDELTPPELVKLLPPVLAFNLALVADHKPGYQLEAIAWYEWYLTLVPDAQQMPEIRQRISVLLREFDAMQAAKIDMTLRLFGEIQELYEQRVVAYGGQRVANNERLLRAEESAIRRGIQNAAAALIFMGREDEGLSVLSEFGLSDVPNPHLMVAFIALGMDHLARRFGPGDGTFDAARDYVASVRQAVSRDCKDGKTLQHLFELVEEVTKAYNDEIDLEWPSDRETIKDNYGDDEVFASSHVRATEQLPRLGMSRWQYRMLREACS